METEAEAVFLFGSEVIVKSGSTINGGAERALVCRHGHGQGHGVGVGVGSTASHIKNNAPYGTSLLVITIFTRQGSKELGIH